MIEQIAKHGRYVDAYNVVRLDRTRDYGESLILINPYRRPVLASIRSHDGQQLPRMKIPPQSGRRVDLSFLLAEEATEWVGRVQLTANNRLVVYDVKHSLRDPAVIFDHEHMDPFRGEPTHIPLTRRFRQELGRLLRKRP